MHPDLEPIAFLLGTWRGEGTGVYPTISGFAYGEEIRFVEVGKPFLAYTQRTWALDDGRPLHAEAGYWRPQPGGRLEVVLAHPTGVTEIQEGTVGPERIELEATVIGRTASAKDVAGLTRTFERTAPDRLRYEVAMAAAGQPLQLHLSAELQRVPDA
ncbi:MAG: FABP family protein [Acidimicrobiia bacterium]